MGGFLSNAKFNLGRWLGICKGSKPLHKRKKAGSTLKPELLCLEERVTPATYTVSSLSDSGAGTLRDAINKANGTKDNDTINISIKGTIGLKSALPSIASTTTAGRLAILGSGVSSLILNGNTGSSSRDFRIFNISSGGDLTLRDLTISGAKSSGSGAAIYNRGGTANVSSCAFTNNTAGTYGGAIRNDTGTFTVSSTTISNNKAENGGGISNHSKGKVLVSSSTLSGNTAVTDGGGIFNYGSTDVAAFPSYVSASYSTLISGNSAGRRGGGVFNRFGTVNINNSTTISGNTATARGGAISTDSGSTRVLSKSTLKDNSAGDFGGGIFSTGNGTLTIDKSTLSGNSVTNNNGVGGGISNTLEGSVFITSSTISGNSIANNKGNGGGIHSSGSGKVTITSSTFSSNKAQDGGGIFNESTGSYKITGSTFSSNSATRDGGGIFNHGGDFEIESSTISDNVADTNAGGIYSWHESALAIEYSTVKNNTSNWKGGGLFIDGADYKKSSESYVYYSRIEGNTSRQGGGIFNNGQLLVFASTIDSNTARVTSTNPEPRDGCGGGIFNGEQGQLLIYDSTIQSNKADGDGGGTAAFRPLALPPIGGKWYIKLATFAINSLIDSLRPTDPFAVYNSTFAFNEAGKKGNLFSPGYGGGIYTTADTTIINSTIVFNSAITDAYPSPGMGGGLARRNFTLATTSLLTIENTIIANNIGTDYVAERALFGAESTTRGYGDINRLLVSDCSFDFIVAKLYEIFVYPDYQFYFLPVYADPNAEDPPIGYQLNPNYSGQFFGDSDISFIIADPLLGPLQNNGGPTLTMALGAGSPAIDQGIIPNNRNFVLADAIARDQRAYSRDPYLNGYPDIGSFEYQHLAAKVLVTSAKSASGSSTISVDDPVTHQPAVAVEDPFPGFTGEIHVASGNFNGDFNGDAIGDIIAGAGAGGGPAVAIMDSQTGRVIRSFFAFDPAFRGGVQVAAIDYNLDGVMDILVGAGPGGGPHVKVFNGANLEVLASFFAYEEDFQGGVSIAALDINGDGVRDLITGAGPGGGPHVKVWDGATRTLLSQWFAYGADFMGGVNVSGGYLGNDGIFKVITGAGAGGAPEVAVWNPLTGEAISRFLAYGADFTGGVHVGVDDGNGDGFSDLITGAGLGGGPHVKGFSFPTLDMVFEFFAGDTTDRNGVFVS